MSPTCWATALFVQEIFLDLKWFEFWWQSEEKKPLKLFKTILVSRNTVYLQDYSECLHILPSVCRVQDSCHWKYGSNTGKIFFFFFTTFAPCSILILSKFYLFTNWCTSKKVKVKCTLVQALRLCTGRTARKGSRGIALLFLDHSTRRGWGVSVTPRPLFTPGKDLVPIVQEAGWTLGPVWTGAENLAPAGIRSPDRPERSQSRYLTELSRPSDALLNCLKK